ncbi:hypothetical protein [Denitromonas iodatirespirans]|uniref:Peptide ABC transporter substrate-binding protein n=1 Tax=Denitromonas iodatirespirans TaxID=2795389 RepID=A0A944DHB2_DENI1|nr:hypothetical protein [Denitromonas iodatirespirans]MBT0962868.1 hypothetical protein [Denitromonas iodatirespirans]
MKSIRESDWKVLRRLHPVALERYCERTLGECVQVATDGGESAHARYLALYRLVKARDKTLAMAFDDLRRSTAITTLIALVGLDLLTAAELDALSDETREIVLGALEPLRE